MIALVKKYRCPLLCFVIPILSSYILNIGIIHNIPNKIELLNDIVSTLSKTIPNALSTILLLGVSAAFVVFFAIVPVSYSIRAIPLAIIRKYIFKHINTYSFFSFESSVVLILVCFSSFQYIHKINVFLSLTLFIGSVIASVIYFYWFTKIMSSPSDIFLMILNNVHFEDLKGLEDSLKSKREEIEKNIADNEALIKDETEDLFALISSHNQKIMDTRKGVLTDINIPKLIELIEVIQDKISSININVNVGDSLPKPEYNILPGILSKYSLVTINYKTHEDNQLISEFIEANQNELENCFSIDGTQDKFAEYRELIDDLLLCYETALVSRDSAFKNIMESFESLIFNEYFKNEDKWDTKISIEEDIFKYLMNKLFEASKYNLSEDQFKYIITFLYHLKNLAVKNESLVLMFSMLDLMNILFVRMFNMSSSYNPQFASYILNINEVTFRNGLKEKVANQSDEEFQRDSHSLYNPIAYRGLNSAILCLSHIIDNFNDKPYRESYNYLSINCQYLIEFFNPLFHWKDIQELKDWKKEKSIQLSRYLLYLAILMYLRAEKGEIAQIVVREIAFPMANQCHNFSKHFMIKVEKIFDEVFYSYEFRTPTDYPASDWFESPIHSAGTYTPSIYNFNKFWIAFSLFRKHNNEDFIPTKINNDKKYEFDNLLEYSQNIQTNHLQIISEILNIDMDTIERLFKEYQEHLANISNPHNQTDNIVNNP